MKKAMKGFTLVEIMIVVAIIAILAAVAIPNFVKYRNQSQATACISNMKQLQAAYEQAKLAGVASPTFADLVGQKKYIKNDLVCPADKSQKNDGAYTLPTDTANPTCKIQPNGDSDGNFKHELPEAAAAS